MASFWYLYCWRHSGIFIVNFKHISHFVLFIIINFEQVNACWDVSLHKCSIYVFFVINVMRTELSSLNVNPKPKQRYMLYDNVTLYM